MVLPNIETTDPPIAMGKRSREEEEGTQQHAQKKRKGFTVGPANLPDGTYRRKAQKIKSDLIQKAKVKKAYAKVKAQEDEEDQPSYNPYAAEERTENSAATAESVSVEIHPERVAMLEEPEPQPVPDLPHRRRERRNYRTNDSEDVNGFATRHVERKPNPPRYKKEFAQAEERKLQFEAKQRARAERDQDRRAMAKARRPGKDGQMKLGRQATVLLSRVRKLVTTGDS